MFKIVFDGFYQSDPEKREWRIGRGQELTFGIGSDVDCKFGKDLLCAEDLVPGAWLTIKLDNRPSDRVHVSVSDKFARYRYVSVLAPGFGTRMVRNFVDYLDTDVAGSDIFVGQNWNEEHSVSRIRLEIYGYL